MKKPIIVTAVILLVLGIAIFAGTFIASGFDLSKLSITKYETNTYEIDEDFQNIEIVTREADVIFKPSEDGKVKVVCVEKEKEKNSVAVEDGTLKIVREDAREWYEFLSLFSKSQSITVYLPEGTYSSLSVDGSTGDVTVPGSFAFDSISIDASTCDVDCRASSEGLVKISLSTGDIKVSGVSAGALDLSVSTGDITLSSVACEGDVSLKVTNGAAVLSKVTCKNLTSDGTTGGVTMNDVVASGSISIKRSTGDIEFEKCDAAEIAVETSTGDVTGTLLSEKVFIAKTSTGDIDIPETVAGGKCRITTSTGDIEIKLSGK